MESKDFEVGDLVWAKMKGYPPWPARITEPPEEPKPPKNKKAHYVYFFGSENYAWILDENINLHNENILKSIQDKKKSSSYQNAVDTLLSFAKGKSSPNVKVKISPKSPKPKTTFVKVMNCVKKSPKRKVYKLKHTNRKRSFNDDESSEENFYGKSQKLDNDKYPRTGTVSPSLSRSSDSKYATEVPNLKAQHVKPTKKRIGFIGLGLMGKAIVKNLITSGHDVTLWNKTTYKCDSFASMGAKKAYSPADLICSCDITFCSVSDPVASKSLIFGDRGVLKGLEQAQKMGYTDKGYVEMTSIDAETSQEIAEAVVMKGGKYLEAPVCGTSLTAQDGSLLILASGDRKLFTDCETCFHAMSKHAYYISCAVGSGARMSIVLSTVSGAFYAALAEIMALVDSLKLSKKEFLKILGLGPFQWCNIMEKGQMMDECDFTPVTPLKHIQKDMSFALEMGDAYSQHMPVTAAANEVYKHARLLKYSDRDVSAVFQAARY